MHDWQFEPKPSRTHQWNIDGSAFSVNNQKGFPHHELNQIPDKPSSLSKSPYDLTIYDQKRIHRVPAKVQTKKLILVEFNIFLLIWARLNFLVFECFLYRLNTKLLNKIGYI